MKKFIITSIVDDRKHKNLLWHTAIQSAIYPDSVVVDGQTFDKKDFVLEDTETFNDANMPFPTPKDELQELKDEINQRIKCYQIQKFDDDSYYIGIDDLFNIINNLISNR